MLINSCLYSQQEERRWETIKGDLRSGDTVFLVNEWTFSYYQGDTFVYRNAVYIEPNNKLPEYYKTRIGDFSLRKNHGDGGNEYLYIDNKNSVYINIDNHFYKYDEEFDGYNLKEIFVTIKKKKIPENLPTKWIPLYLYNNDYYLYDPCQRIIPKYNITDTLLMYYGWMDGIYAFSYHAIVQKSENHYVIHDIKGFHNKKINIYILDRKKGFAVFKFDNYTPRLYVDAEKIENFPLIVNYCEELYPEYKFEKIDLKKFKKR